MSELRAMTVLNAYQLECNDNDLVYLKSEADKVIAHQKMKRCVAMAEWCDAEADVADADGDYEDMLWYQKWHKRWLELAEHYKEMAK